MHATPAMLLLIPALAFAQADAWDDAWDDWDDDAAHSAWSGFAEGALGSRLEGDPLIDGHATLADVRLRIEGEWYPAGVVIELKGDAGYDAVEDEPIAELRELAVSFSPAKSTDVKLGRQVLTWGTGDLLFLNDLFPKDFVSFFAGRDDEYLKAPANAVRITGFRSLVNVDFVWTPAFEPDNYLTGERFSFFSPLAGGNVAPDPPQGAIGPDDSFSNGEFALRLFRNVESTEYAVYAYRGFFKQPNALTADLEPTFAPLSAIGASLRRPAGPGLFNTELAWYVSRDDRSGSDPRVPNDQLRFLAGYEWEALPRFTVGLQYYLEWTQDHDELVAASEAPEYEPREFRHLVTNRLTWRTGRDRYTLSMFTFFSPSDRDWYLRPSFTWRYSDELSFAAGGNFFGGEERHTFFNQLQDASNVYLRLRYNWSL